MYKVHVWSKFDKCYNPLCGVYPRFFLDGLRDMGYIVISVPFNFTQN